MDVDKLLYGQEVAIECGGSIYNSPSMWMGIGLG